MKHAWNEKRIFDTSNDAEIKRFERYLSKENCFESKERVDSFKDCL